MPYDSDADEFGAWLDGVIADIGWDMPGADGGGTLAASVAEVVIDGQQGRARGQYGVDSGWDDNKPRYAAEKRGRYGEGNGPNYRTHQMLSRESMRGRIEAGREQATWTYGTGLPSPDGRTNHDRTITDTDKAWYANEAGQSRGDLFREFHGIAHEDADNALPVVEDAIAAHMVRKAQAT